MFCLKDIIIYNISFLFVGTLGAFLKTKLLVYSTSQDIGQWHQYPVIGLSKLIFPRIFHV